MSHAQRVASAAGPAAGNPLSGAGLRVFRGATEAMVPRAATLDSEEWRAGAAIAAAAVAQRPPAVRRQLGFFLRVLNLLPVIRYGRSFTALDPARRLRVLRWLERSPVLALRRGVWGLRTLGFMAVYAQAQIQQVVGYRADPRGWEARPGAATAATLTDDGDTGGQD